jgi:hypothetical protein
MLCQRCQLNHANVHLSRWRRALGLAYEAVQPEPVEQHFCEECAAKEKTTNPLLNPLLGAGPGVRRIQGRVLSIDADRITIRPFSIEPPAPLEDISLSTARIPERYALGDHFGVICNDAELEWLKGKEGR